MCLINHYVLPVDFLQSCNTKSNTFIAGHYYIELLRSDDLQAFLTFFFCRCKFDGSCARKPFLEFSHPIAKGNLGGDDDMWPFDALELSQEAKHGN